MSDRLRFPVPIAPPPDRGRLLKPVEVAGIVGASEAWARRHVPFKLQLGHSTVRWHEKDVREWLERCRNAEPTPTR